MLIGVDASHHNDSDVVTCGADFMFLKATEGTTYRDPKLKEHLDTIAKSHTIENLPIIGFYHYARPENGNTPMDEAENYLRAVSPHIGSCLHALDFEGDALSWTTRNKQAAWISEFLQIVNVRTNFAIPFLYMSSSAFKILEPLVKQRHGYWIAHYGKSKPSFVPAGNVKYIHQFCSTKVDVNWWNGNIQELARYATGV